MKHRSPLTLFLHPQPLCSIFLWEFLFEKIFICYRIASVLWFGFLAATCGIFVPQPGTEPTPSALESKILASGTTDKSLLGVSCGDRECYQFLVSSFQARAQAHSLYPVPFSLFPPLYPFFLYVFICSLHRLAPRARILVNCQPSRVQGRGSSCTDLPSPTTGCLALSLNPTSSLEGSVQ